MWALARRLITFTVLLFVGSSLSSCESRLATMRQTWAKSKLRGGIELSKNLTTLWSNMPRLGAKSIDENVCEWFELWHKYFGLNGNFCEKHISRCHHLSCSCCCSLESDRCSWGVFLVVQVSGGISSTCITDLIFMAAALILFHSFRRRIFFCTAVCLFRVLCVFFVAINFVVGLLFSFVDTNVLQIEL